jgi:hypothetical protein
MVPLDEARLDSLGYRKRQDADIWHFCSNCSRWPRFDYIELWVKPTSGKICSECEGKRLQDDCCPDTSPTLYKEG